MQQVMQEASQRPSGERNLWSGKRIGGVGGGGGGGVPGAGNQAKRREHEAAKFRCQPELDVGRTRGSEADQHTFCTYFAK